jgi:hypothetical protein
VFFFLIIHFVSIVGTVWNWPRYTIPTSYWFNKTYLGFPQRSPSVYVRLWTGSGNTGLHITYLLGISNDPTHSGQQSTGSGNTGLHTLGFADDPHRLGPSKDRIRQHWFKKYEPNSATLVSIHFGLRRQSQPSTPAMKRIRNGSGNTGLYTLCSSTVPYVYGRYRQHRFTYLGFTDGPPHTLVRLRLLEGRRHDTTKFSLKVYKSIWYR